MQIIVLLKILLRISILNCRIKKNVGRMNVLNLLKYVHKSNNICTKTFLITKFHSLISLFRYWKTLYYGKKWVIFEPHFSVYRLRDMEHYNQLATIMGVASRKIIYCIHIGAIAKNLTTLDPNHFRHLVRLIHFL